MISSPPHKLRLLGSALLVFLVALMCACSSGGGTLEEKIREIADSPELQNEQGLDELTAIILADPETYKTYIKPDGTVDLARLQQAVDRIGKNVSPSFAWDLTLYGGVPVKDLRLNLFVERSGSMTGYDARSTSGDFKRTLNELVTRFPHSGGAGGGHIFVVNDAVYPYSGTFEQFVQEKDIFAATKNIGDASFTDFGKIFEYVLRDTVAENISVLVTDLIYSPKGTEGLTPAKIFNEEQSLATTLFQKHGDKSVMVVRLSSDFDGLYYPYDSPQSGKKYTGQRPYYLVITGSAAAMHKLRHDSRYASFVDFATLPGYRSHYIFSRGTQPTGRYTLLPRSRGTSGSYTIVPRSGSSGSGDGAPGVHALKDLKAGSDGMTGFRIAADLSSIAADSNYLLDPANYRLSGGGVARLKKVEKVTPEMTDARNRRYLEGATHLFTVEVDPSNAGKRLDISLADNIPVWFREASATSDISFGGNFATTTFGLSSILEGIYRAYHGTADTPALFSLSIAISPD